MRLLFFIILVIIAFNAPWYVLLSAAVLYTFKYTIYQFELVFLGVLLDVNYGMGLWYSTFPFVYTTCAFLIIFSAKVLAPRINAFRRPH